MYQSNKVYSPSTYGKSKETFHVSRDNIDIGSRSKNERIDFIRYVFPNNIKQNNDEDTHLKKAGMTDNRFSLLSNSSESFKDNKIDFTFLAGNIYSNLKEVKSNNALNVSGNGCYKFVIDHSSVGLLSVVARESQHRIHLSLISKDKNVREKLINSKDQIVREIESEVRKKVDLDIE